MAVGNLLKKILISKLPKITCPIFKYVNRCIMELSSTLYTYLL